MSDERGLATDKPDRDTRTARTRQRLMVVFGAALAASGILVWTIATERGRTAPEAASAGLGAEKVLSSITAGASAERGWVGRSEARFKALEEQLSALKARNERLEQRAAAMERDASTVAAMPETAVPFAEPARPDGGAAADADLTDPFRSVAGDAVPGGAPPVPEAVPGVAAPALSLVDFALADRSDGDGAKSLAHYLPAGSYAPAVVISGVDATASVNAQADPRPVLFRIVGPAVTAARGGERQLVAGVVGCTVTGASHADLSSEKVYTRLQTMTCAPAEGSVVETAVYGYPAGLGKAGVRGPVISREGDLVAKAFMAGTVGGLGEMATQVLSPASNTALFGGTTRDLRPDARDVAGSGLGGGLHSAADRVSEYLIKRAEQYQAVIPMQAGTRVELVFIKGSRLDGGAPGSAAVKEETAR